MMKKVLVLTVLIALALSPILADQKKGLKNIVTPYDPKDIQFDFENQWALIVGICDYSKIKDLDNAAYEAQKLEKLLIDKYGFSPHRTRYPYRKVEHLFNKNATYEAIIERLDWYRDNLKKEDRLFIYFSGHGYVDRNGIGYWLPYNVGDDLKISRTMKGDEIINKSSKKILNYVMVKFLEKCKAKHIFVVADSCYAGEIFSEFKGGELPAQLIKEKSRQLLAAGSSVVPDPSPFTNFLIDFLNNNNQPYLIGSIIISKAKENLGKNLAPRGGYVPKTGSKGGEFVFKLKDFKPPPRTAPVSLEKYEKEIQATKIKKEWDEWQQNFKTSVQRVKELEENRDLSVRSKIEAWKEVWETFNKKNPFSDEDEKPPHTVYLDGYSIGKYEVTFAQYDKYCEETQKNKPADNGWGIGKRPVINVSWVDVQAYCDWLSKKTGFKFKLPTEAQWEKAARGTDDHKYPCGSHNPYYNGKYYANYDPGKDEADGFRNTAPVGSFSKGMSPYGLLDMAGNVWEWCGDWYDRDYYKNAPKKNPSGPKSGTYRVFRGGSWSNNEKYLRSANRGLNEPSNRFNNVGFRLCQEYK